MKKIFLFLAAMVVSIFTAQAINFQVVTSVSDITDGAEYVIGSGTNGQVYFMSNESNANNRKTTAATVTDGVVTATDNMLIISVILQDSTILLQTTNYQSQNGYLQTAPAGTGSNQLKVADYSYYAEFSYWVNSYDSTFVATGVARSDRNNMRFNPNNGTPLFSCYTSGQQNIYLYKAIPAPAQQVTTTINFEPGFPWMSGSYYYAVLSDGSEPLGAFPGMNARQGRGTIQTLDITGTEGLTCTLTANDGTTDNTTAQGLVFTMANQTINNVVVTAASIYVNTPTVAVTGIDVLETGLTLTVTDVYQLNATITPADATNQLIHWTSSNVQVASVSEVGVVSALAAGNATIYATTDDGSFVDSCSVTVNAYQVPTMSCHEAISAYGTTLNQNDSVKVAGYIVDMTLKAGNFNKYGSVTIWLNDTATGTTRQFELYNCYSSEKDTFVFFGPNYTATGSTELHVDTIVDKFGRQFRKGDLIISAGKITLYSGTYELNSGCYIAGGEMPREARAFIGNKWEGTEQTWKEMTWQNGVPVIYNVVYDGEGLYFNWAPIAKRAYYHSNSILRAATPAVAELFPLQAGDTISVALDLTIGQASIFNAIRPQGCIPTSSQENYEIIVGDTVTAWHNMTFGNYEVGRYTLTDTLVNAGGCDSVCVLNLTVNDPLPVLDSINSCANIINCYDRGVINNGDTVKVAGYISGMFLKPTNFAKYGSVSVWLTDTMGGTAHEFELYNCYSYNGDTLVYFGPNFTLEGTTSIDVDTVMDGNGVIFLTGAYIEAIGTITKYQTTYELNTGCYFTAGGIEPQVEDTLMYIKHPFDGQNWEWRQMESVDMEGLGTLAYELEATWGGVGFNVDPNMDDATALWFSEADIMFLDEDNNTLYTTPAIGQTVLFGYTPLVNMAVVVFTPATALDEVKAEGEVKKIVKNNQVMIIRDGKAYNVLGEVVK